MHSRDDIIRRLFSNKNRTTLYIGLTNNLERRMLEHKAGVGSIFASKYNLTNLLYFESIHGMKNAIKREKQLKNWHKERKWNLIKEQNPELTDIAKGWFSIEQIIECRERKVSKNK